MANRKKFYALPDYQTVTEDVDQYAQAWQQIAAPVQQALGLSLTGFDPDFMFTKGNPQRSGAVVSLPLWFVRDLANKLQSK